VEAKWIIFSTLIVGNINIYILGKNTITKIYKFKLGKGIFYIIHNLVKGKG